MKYPDTEALISVVIPAYNSQEFLAEAVQSVRAQGYPNIEIIVVDDGSTDRTAEIAKSLGPDVQYHYQENQGPSAARNTGIVAAKGDFIAFLDSDDLYPSDKFAIQLNTFANDPSLEVVTGRIQYVSLDGAEDNPIDFESDDQTIIHVHLGSMLTRRSVFENVGLFDTSLRFSEDVEWWMRVREKKTRFVVLPDITLQYRLHGTNMTRGRSGIDKPLLSALKKSLDRRRASGEMHMNKMTDFVKDKDVS